MLEGQNKARRSSAKNFYFVNVVVVVLKTRNSFSFFDIKKMLFGFQIDIEEHGTNDEEENRQTIISTSKDIKKR